MTETSRTQTQLMILSVLERLLTWLVASLFSCSWLCSSFGPWRKNISVPFFIYPSWEPHMELVLIRKIVCMAPHICSRRNSSRDGSLYPCSGHSSPFSVSRSSLSSKEDISFFLGPRIYLVRAARANIETNSIIINIDNGMMSQMDLLRLARRRRILMRALYLWL